MVKICCQINFPGGGGLRLGWLDGLTENKTKLSDELLNVKWRRSSTARGTACREVIIGEMEHFKSNLEPGKDVKETEETEYCHQFYLELRVKFFIYN